MSDVMVEAAAAVRAEAGDRADFRRGALAMGGLLAGYAPFACLIGVAVAGSDTPWAAWSGVWLVFAGTAHLTVIQLVDTGAGVWVAALSAVVINIRLALFSATLSPHWRGTPVRARLVAAATMIDPSWMLASRRAAEGGDAVAVRRFYGGVTLVLWFGWAALVTVGAVAGNLIPAGAGLTLLAPLCLLAMVLPGARSGPGAACVVTAALVAVAAADLPAGVGLLAAMPAGMAAAALVGRARRRGRAR